MTDHLRSRLDFMQMDGAQRDLLASAQSDIAELIGPALDRFYAAARANPETNAFFRDAGHMNQAKAAQQSHWRRVASGRFDQDYYDSVRRIGSVHARIGLEPKWYVAAYALVVENLIKGVAQRYSPWRRLLSLFRLPAAEDVTAAIVKAALMDMELSISIYIEEAQSERTRATEALDAALKRLADGDLTAEVSGLPQSFAGLELSYNQTLARMRDTIGSVSANASAIRTGSTEVSQASNDLSRRTEQQAASLEETAAAMTEITATVHNSAAGANEANKLVRATQADAQESSKVVGDAVAAMAEIEKSSQQITKIIAVIDKIAFQTNLLALNASVEAAHAGEAGRAFAVVANEVRALAQRSADAAQEIGTLISNSSKQVEGGVTLVGEAGKALGRIIGSIDEVSGLVGQIALAADQQSSALAQVNTAITEMDRMTQQNAAMVEQTSAAAASLTSQAEALATETGSFRVDSSARSGTTIRRAA